MIYLVLILKLRGLSSLRIIAGVTCFLGWEKKI